MPCPGRPLHPAEPPAPTHSSNRWHRFANLCGTPPQVGHPPRQSRSTCLCRGNRRSGDLRYRRRPRRRGLALHLPVPHARVSAPHRDAVPVPFLPGQPPPRNAVRPLPHPPSRPPPLPSPPRRPPRIPPPRPPPPARPSSASEAGVVVSRWPRTARRGRRHRSMRPSRPPTHQRVVEGAQGRRRLRGTYANSAPQRWALSCLRRRPDPVNAAAPFCLCSPAPSSFAPSAHRAAEAPPPFTSRPDMRNIPPARPRPRPR